MGWLDGDFFVYSDETDFCRRLHDAGWRILFVPGARAVHHDQLGTDAAAMRRRIVEFHRNRDLYFRKHGMHLTRLVWKACWIWAYLVRAAAAAVLPGRDPRRYLLHAQAGAAARAAARASAKRRRHTTAGLPNNVPRTPWSTLTPPNWPLWVARSGRCSSCWRAGGCRCSPAWCCSAPPSSGSRGRSAEVRSTG